MNINDNKNYISLPKIINEKQLLCNKIIEIKHNAGSFSFVKYKYVIHVGNIFIAKEKGFCFNSIFERFFYNCTTIFFIVKSCCDFYYYADLEILLVSNCDAKNIVY